MHLGMLGGHIIAYSLLPCRNFVFALVDRRVSALAVRILSVNPAMLESLADMRFGLGLHLRALQQLCAVQIRKATGGLI